jgi:hypothetical protein
MKKEEIIERIAKGELSIESIDPELVERYKLKVGDITPFTRLKIVSVTGA